MMRGFFDGTHLMNAKKSRKASQIGQIDKFKQAAHELECDDGEARFKERFKKLTEAPPPESVRERKGKSTLKLGVAGKQKASKG
jgi:hypothetical protein